MKITAEEKAVLTVISVLKGKARAAKDEGNMEAHNIWMNALVTLNFLATTYHE